MLKRLFAASALVLVTAGAASAQTWDAPLFASPRPMDDVGLYYINSDREGADNSNGLKLIWRQSGNLNLGVHVGTGDLNEIGESILLGAELYGPLNLLSTNNGLVMSWTLGIGAAFGSLGETAFGEDVEYIDFSVPAGVSIGMRLGSGGLALTPFVHPRVSLDVASITVGDEEETDTDFGFAVDLGAELNMTERLLLRAAYSLGDRDAFGIGVALRTPRRISGPAR